MSILFAQLIVFLSLFSGVTSPVTSRKLAILQDTSSVIVATIHPYKSVTNGAFFQVMVLSSPDCSVEYLHGFDFKWGHQYRVRLKETKLANPPMDGSSLEYELLEVLSDTKMPDDYEFTMWLSRDLYLGHGDDQVGNLVKKGDSTYLYMDEVNIQIGIEMTVTMDKVLLENKDVRAHFTVVNENTIRLK